jgi:hypothetical protein
MGRTGESPTRRRETPRAGRVPSLSLSPVVASQPRSKKLEANRESGPLRALLAIFFWSGRLRLARLGDRAFTLLMLTC